MKKILCCLDGIIKYCFPKKSQEEMIAGDPFITSVNNRITLFVFVISLFAFPINMAYGVLKQRSEDLSAIEYRKKFLRTEIVYRLNTGDFLKNGSFTSYEINNFYKAISGSEERGTYYFYSSTRNSGILDLIAEYNSLQGYKINDTISVQIVKCLIGINQYIENRTNANYLQKGNDKDKEPVSNMYKVCRPLIRITIPT